MVVGDGGAAFERAVAKLDYPMLIATTCADGELSGCLVGFATQVSMDPARFLVCISNENHTFRVAANASHLAVHYIAAHRMALARLFGEQTGDEIDKFACCEWALSSDDVPVLADAEYWFTGPIIDRMSLGDHTGFVIEPDCGGASERSVELLSARSVRDFEPGHGA